MIRMTDAIIYPSLAWTQLVEDSAPVRNDLRQWWSIFNTQLTPKVKSICESVIRQGSYRSQMLQWWVRAGLYESPRTLLVKLPKLEWGRTNISDNGKTTVQLGYLVQTHQTADLPNRVHSLVQPRQNQVLGTDLIRRRVPGRCDHAFEVVKTRAYPKISRNQCHKRCGPKWRKQKWNENSVKHKSH